MNEEENEISFTRRYHLILGSADMELHPWFPPELASSTHSASHQLISTHFQRAIY
jgi:hypothetical protein